MRGAVYRMRRPKDRQGHEQDGPRRCVVVQASVFAAMSTWLVAPTSTSARPAPFRPEIQLRDGLTRVMVEQTRAIDPETRLLEQVGFISDMAEIDAALRLLLSL